MSTVVKKIINVKIDGQEVSVPEGTVILEAAKSRSLAAFCWVLPVELVAETPAHAYARR